MKQSTEPEDFKSNSPENVPQESYTCPICGLTSHNPYDALYRYCAHCHRFQEQIEISVMEIVDLMHDPYDGFEGLAEALQRGAEPFWMQDVRVAQKRIEARRTSSRPNHSP